MDGWKIPKQFGVKRQLDSGAVLSAVQMKVGMKHNPVLMAAVIRYQFWYAWFWRPHKNTYFYHWVNVENAQLISNTMGKCGASTAQKCTKAFHKYTTYFPWSWTKPLNVQCSSGYTMSEMWIELHIEMPILLSNRVTLCELNVQFYIKSSNTRRKGERWPCELAFKRLKRCIIETVERKKYNFLCLSVWVIIETVVVYSQPFHLWNSICISRHLFFS